MSSIQSTARALDPQSGSAAQAAGRAPGNVVSAVRDASARTGVDFSYLMEKAAVESGYRTDVKAKTSSATGLFQFVERTWLDMVEQHGAKYGLARFSAAIDRDSNGAPVVSDPSRRKEILELRKDPKVSALMAGELVKANQSRLEAELDRPIGKTELYMAHFLGAGGASKFLRAMDSNPDRSAATLMPDAARANRNVFFDNNGRPRSLCQIFDRFACKFGEEGATDQQAGSFSKVQGDDGSSQPWLSTRSAGSAQPPLSTFTAMMLSQLAPPLGDDDKSEQQARNNDGNGGPWKRKPGQPDGNGSSSLGAGLGGQAPNLAAGFAGL
jgi:hypothetical protein